MGIFKLIKFIYSLFFDKPFDFIASKGTPLRVIFKKEFKPKKPDTSRFSQKTYEEEEKEKNK